MNTSYNHSNHGHDPYDWKPWIGIAIAWMVVWPVGLVLTIHKLMEDQKKRQTRQKIDQQRTFYADSNSEWRAGAAHSFRDDYQAQPKAAKQKTQPKKSTKSKTDRQKIINTLCSPKSARGFFISGGIVTGIFGFSVLMEIAEAIQWGWFYFDEFFPLLTFTAVGIVLLGAGVKRRKRSRKFRSYFARIANRPQVSIQELADLTRSSFDKTVDDLQYLLEKGAFGSSAHLDLGKGILVLDPLAAQQEELNRKAAEAQAVKNANKDPSEEILREIRQINDRIDDTELSAKIDRIEEITRLILQCQKDHPEKAPQLTSFLSYYLPTTLKILRSYAEMERQNAPGKNVSSTKARIEGLMDKVVLGFETQLDQLFAADSMDIAADITVMEQMLQKDGLTGEQSSPFSSASGGSAVQFK